MQGTSLYLSSEEPEAGGSVGFESLRLLSQHQKVCLFKNKIEKKKKKKWGGVRFASE